MACECIEISRNVQLADRMTREPLILLGLRDAKNAFDINLTSNLMS